MYLLVAVSFPWHSKSKEKASSSALLARKYRILKEGTWNKLWKKLPCFLRLFFPFLRIFSRTLESWRHRFFQNWYTPELLTYDKMFRKKFLKLFFLPPSLSSSPPPPTAPSPKNLVIILFGEFMRENLCSIYTTPVNWLADRLAGSWSPFFISVKF